MWIYTCLSTKRYNWVKKTVFTSKRNLAQHARNVSHLNARMTISDAFHGELFPVLVKFWTRMTDAITLLFFSRQLRSPKCRAICRGAPCRPDHPLRWWIATSADARHCDFKPTDPTDRPPSWSSDTRSAPAIGDSLKTQHINQLPFIQYDAPRKRRRRTRRSGAAAAAAAATVAYT